MDQWLLRKLFLNVFLLDRKTSWKFGLFGRNVSSARGSLVLMILPIINYDGEYLKVCRGVDRYSIRAAIGLADFKRRSGIISDFLQKI